MKNNYILVGRLGYLQLKYYPRNKALNDCSLEKSVSFGSRKHW